VAAYASRRALVTASYDGVRGHPVLIGRDHWEGVRALALADRGARDYLKSHTVAEVPCEDVADGTDADRPEDLPE
jgi:CTP:molybdopterin cytidylyltransferase MocA